MQLHDLRFPDFLGIGASRSGTTWLNVNLRRHPDIWMPPLKEIHYFDRSLDKELPGILGTSSLLSRIFSAKRHNKKWRRAAFNELVVDALRRPNLARYRWNLRYYLGSYDDRWYASLFKPGNGKVIGEISPGYSTLAADDVKRVHQIMSDAKIIYLIRNPVERDWSALLHRTNKSFGPIGGRSIEELKQALLRPRILCRGDYLAAITTWQEHFPKKQILIGFFDEIKQDPVGLINRIFDFLDVEPIGTEQSGELYRKVNPSNPTPVPPQIREFLLRHYHPMLKQLSEMLGGYATKWLNEAESLLNAKTAQETN